MRAISLNIDVREAHRHIVHVLAHLPVRSGSTASFTTPLWICESHKPNGPVGNVAGLFVRTENNQVLPWCRDATELYVYHVNVPKHVTTLIVGFDALITNVTRRMMMLVWDSVLLHHAHRPVARMPVQATIRIPGDWDYSTALGTETLQADVGHDGHRRITFRPVSAERLEDSPTLLGKHLCKASITPDGRHKLCAAFSEPALTAVPQDRLDKLARMVREAALVFGPPPYQSYRFLSVSSDLLVSPDTGLVGGGLEHAESCHLITSGRAFADAAIFDWQADLFSHEYVHVWNGKYRRPAGHVPADFTTPLDGTLLWVYEGLTQYYGLVLAGRSGLCSFDTLRTKLAISVADMQCQSGRVWRSTEDTARGVSQRAKTGTGWASWAQGGDYYDEGGLLWLDADTLIRSRTGGNKSLDDFCRIFFDTRGATEPLVVPYVLAEITATLRRVLPCCDWDDFFRERVQRPQAQTNTAGLVRAGYNFVYTNEKSYSSPAPKADLRLAVWHSVGLRISETGTVVDVRRHSAADRAGLAPTQQITHVGGKKYSLEEMTAQLAATLGEQDSSTGGGDTKVIKLSLTQDEDSWEAEIEHTIGLVYPALERQTGEEARRDLLADIFAPRVGRDVDV